ncbi:MAG: nitronate monooxygenase [Flexistipes sinusarabici]|uniref:Nitronate monooxygenase n=1 Tax=Flexistipes sinusarabici TaxID=2352 RepID=A0A5D0MLS5_FLESI|nr:nitronate monooxygenase [Flexistipes sinusarabici]TYB33946.1 MAG: nitronate monooxygenase [Flexistipes sinusarabici]
MIHPIIIQGGMGAGVSNWRLAKAVSKLGYLGVVSCTAQDAIFTRRLQNGDPGGDIRRAMKSFPNQDIVKYVMDKYFVEGGIKDSRYKYIPMYTIDASWELKAMSMLSSFVEVYLAKEGHDGIVGINVLEKIRMPNLYVLYGAMLAGVDYVIVGAGIPREIPGVIDNLAEHNKAYLRLNVEGAAPDDDYKMELEPSDFVNVSEVSVKRPYFLAIVSSNTLAMTMAKKATGRVDGFVVEYPSAGGHNAPPRIRGSFNEQGEPVYGSKDYVDTDKLKSLGLPFWLAGGYGSAEQVKNALDLGAAGVQVGTPFAFCRESGFTEEIKRKAIDLAKKMKGKVFTDPDASPTGFPFKVLELKGTLSEFAEYIKRPRRCNLGYLRQLFKKEDGSIGYRCPAEPVEAFVSKGGDPERTKNSKCLCNALLANIGLAMGYESGYVEKQLVTVGDCFNRITDFLTSPEMEYYYAENVINRLLAFSR